MSNEIQFAYGATGSANVKAAILDVLGRKWNGAAFVAVSATSDTGWLSGLVSLTELVSSNSTGTGIYCGDLPTGVAATGDYTFLIYDAATPGPATTVQGICTWSPGQSSATAAATAAALAAIPTNPLLTTDSRLPTTVIAAKSDLPANFASLVLTAAQHIATPDDVHVTVTPTINPTPVTVNPTLTDEQAAHLAAIPEDPQLAGEPVTLPTTAPAGYGGGSITITGQIVTME